MYFKSGWDTRTHGSMNESAIRIIHNAPDRVRVSRYAYRAGDEIEGTSKRCTGYVLEGRFTFVTEKDSVSLEAGDVFEFSGGDYLLRVDDANEAVVVWAWE